MRHADKTRRAKVERLREMADKAWRTAERWQDEVRKAEAAERDAAFAAAPPRPPGRDMSVLACWVCESSCYPINLRDDVDVALWLAWHDRHRCIP